jgi:hypothetical protein
MINSSLHQNIIAAEGGWIVTTFYNIRSIFFSRLLFFVASMGAENCNVGALMIKGQQNQGYQAIKAMKKPEFTVTWHQYRIDVSSGFTCNYPFM